MANLTRAQLRATLRQARNALSASQQQQAADAVASQLLAPALTSDTATVAYYLPNDGEVNLTPFAKKITGDNASVELALPVLHPFSKGHLLFLRYHDSTRMHTNRFGIDEPALDCTAVIPPPALDVILMPLVGFDSQGNRLGMGGGFYDRTLANRHSWPTRPRLIGIAHDCQQVDALPVASWDVPLDAIVTPTQIIRPTSDE